jgi:hypothetical protein
VRTYLFLADLIVQRIAESVILRNALLFAWCHRVRARDLF